MGESSRRRRYIEKKNQQDKTKNQDTIIKMIQKVDVRCGNKSKVVC